MSGIILFQANDGTHGTELWVSDGSAAGAYLVEDIYPGANGSYPHQITALGNGKALFSASDPDGTQLWASDGTAVGTYSLALNAPLYLTAFGDGKAVFGRYDPAHGTELWVSDGTPGGTHLVDDINSGPGSSHPQNFTALGDGEAVFQANDGADGIELWITDGTAAGTHLVNDINPGPGSSLPSNITAIGGGKALFSASDSDGAELWVTDGTAGGTSRVADIYPGSHDSYPHQITAIGGGKAVFSASDSDGAELWVSDGTAGGTSRVADIYPGSHGSYPREITALGNGKALFSASDSDGAQLWVTDGTAAGTYRVTDIPGPLGQGSSPYFTTALSTGRAVFGAGDSIHGYELWVSDGTVSGTHLVADVNPGSGSSYPRNITAIGGGKALFNASDGTQGTELWITDGTAAGTHLLEDINPGSGSSDPNFFGVLQEVPCFCRGTLILTERGEVPVESLAAGDRVVTLGGAATPITWLGRGSRRVTPENRDVRPLIVRAGALGDGVPRRDLRVTRGHSFYLDGVLVPVEFLVNERSILWDDVATEVEFYHIELEDHDVLVAEGAPAESYRDDGNRRLFDNPERARFAAANKEPFAPVLLGGPEVDRIWRALLERSGFAAPEASDDPDLHLIADGARIDAHSVEDQYNSFQGLYRFRLEHAPRELVIASRSMVPLRMGHNHDPRRLGVALRSLRLLSRDCALDLPFDSAWLADGFNNPEPELRHRWTTGYAPLPPQCHGLLSGPFEIALDIVSTTQYPLGAADEEIPVPGAAA